MKTQTFLKGKMIQATLVACILLVASCDFNQKQEDSKDLAEESNEANFDNNQMEKDAQFLVNVAEINLKQIQLGQLAQQRGNTKHVRELGKMLEDAHTKSQRDLVDLAKNKGITIPTSSTDDGQNVYDKLNDKSGKDFDKAYADMMVSKHKDAIGSFEKATTESYDMDIKNWAIASLPDLRTHLNQAIDCQKKCE